MSKEGLIYQVNKPYATDNYGRFRYGPNYESAINPCVPIEDKSICIGRLDNKNLKVRKFLIVDVDRVPVKVVALATGDTIELNYPGKSTFILVKPNACDRMFIHNTAREAFKREADRSDHVHVATVGAIEEAGWIAFYAPLQLNRLLDHVRVVSQRTILTGEEPTEDDAKRLMSAFTFIPNLHG